VFAPGLSVGGFLGGALGSGLHLLFPELVGASAIPVFVVIGMIAVFGSVSHAPVAVLLMVLEMTGSFDLAIPAVLAVTAATVLMRDNTIFQEQRISRVKNWKIEKR
ncbi:MAG: chloride channel protein, partial [Methanocorpusculum sp.]|nr:chloride channel protein [Methanocorpusculum sp.]